MKAFDLFFRYEKSKTALFLSLFLIVSYTTHAFQSNHSSMTSATSTPHGGIFDDIDRIVSNHSCITKENHEAGKGRIPRHVAMHIAATMTKSACRGITKKSGGVLSRRLNNRSDPFYQMTRPAGLLGKYDIFKSKPNLMGAYSKNTMTSDPRNLVPLYNVLLSLAMRESDGKYMEGTDESAEGGSSRKGEEIEAGLHQSSFNALKLGYPRTTALKELYTTYKKNLRGMGPQAIAKFCNAFPDERGESKMSPNLSGSNGNQEAVEFQKLAKECPAFSTELQALILRTNFKHNGPISRDEAKPDSDCEKMLEEIYSISSRMPAEQCQRDFPDLGV